MKNISEYEYLKSEYAKINNLFLKGKFNLVIEKSKKLIRKYPKQLPFYNLLAFANRELGNFTLAIEILKKALKINPNNHTVLNNLGSTYRVMGEYSHSENYLKQAMSIKPNDINIMCNYANLKRDINEFDESIKYYEKAYEMNNQITTIVINLAGAYQIVGKFDLSKKCLEKFLKENGDNVLAHKLLSTINNYKTDNKHQKEMLLTLKNKSLNENDKATLSYSIAKSYDDQKNYKKSFEFFKKANDIQRNLIKNYSSKDEVNLFNKIKNIFKNTDFANFPNNNYNEKKLFFIIGLPRSGTTLTHQILSSHSKIYGAGELFFLDKLMTSNIDNNNFISIFNKYSQDNDDTIKKINENYYSKINYIKTDKNIILDKNPINFEWVGFIKILFPNSKIIHCKRNLKDTALSIYKNSFEINSLRWSNNEDEIVKYVSLYLDLMKFWKEKIPNFIYEIEYKNLIENQNEESRKLIKFCDLNWEENCINFDKISTPIKTVSLAEARKPIYKTSLNSNEKYSNFLEMFKKIDNLKEKY